jgi:hypothetical protein
MAHSIQHSHTNSPSGFRGFGWSANCIFRHNISNLSYGSFPSFAKKKKIAIDVGANQGQYSYYMAKFSKNVIAFEPNTDLWEICAVFLDEISMLKPLRCLGSRQTRRCA